MRISVHPQDPGFRDDAPKFKVLLNGELCDRAVTADEEEGLVVALMKDSEGHFIFDDDHTGIRLERLSGRVEILGPDDPRSRLADMGTIREPKVEIELEDDTGKVRVYVYSRMKPGALKRLVVDPLKIRFPTMAQAVDVAAGAVAEELCAQFGDKFDPSECARAAKEAYQEAVRLRALKAH